MGWLTDRIEDWGESTAGKLAGHQLVKSGFKQDSRVVNVVAGKLGIKFLERESAANVADPNRGIGRAATATALAYLAWAGAGAAGGGAGASGSAGAGGTSLATKVGYGLAASNLVSSLAAARQGEDAPGVAPVTYMPNANDPQATAARRRKTAEIRRRQGRESTILSEASGTLG